MDRQRCAASDLQIASAPPTLAAKSVFLDGNTFQDAKVGGADAIWVSGPHELDLVTHDGTYSRYLVTGNILIWESDGTVLRLETSVGRAAAVRIAESISL